MVIGWAPFDGSGVSARRGGSLQAPAFQVDPLWPRPLPNHWILGSVTGVAVDSRDHVWIVHRGAASLTARTENGLGTDPPTAEECCRPAPPVLEFDASGALVSSWGGPGQGYDWPITPGGIAVDAKGNVWIAAAGWPEPAPARGGGRGGRAGAARGAPATPPPPPRPFDAHILKFSPAGKFLQQIGKPGSSEGNAGKATFGRPANVEIDAAANELYVADGHGNRRVVVLDATTGAYKRHWGAYGAPPDETNPGAYDPAAPPARQFRVVSCVAIARDGLVYVCDRQNNRIQVFRKDGTFVKEGFVSKAALVNGSAWDVAFSSDAAERYLFVADGQDHQVVILQRDTLATVGTIGTGGRWPGAFYAVGSIASDSRGNIYTGETLEGKRVQKFAPRR
jgi:DNA-binding beta-propeller fold protein YncE